MRVWCVRHGEATHNVAWRTEGESAYFARAHVDSALTPLGEAQARACRLPAEVTLVAVSPLRRALQTAALAGAPAGARTVVLEALCEAPRGHTPNIRPTARQAEFPAFDWAGVPPTGPWPHRRLETPEEVAARVRAVRAWLGAAERAGCRALALVAHASVLQALMGGDELPHATAVAWRGYHSQPSAPPSARPASPAG